MTPEQIEIKLPSQLSTEESSFASKLIGVLIITGQDVAPVLAAIDFIARFKKSEDY